MVARGFIASCLAALASIGTLAIAPPALVSATELQSGGASIDAIVAAVRAAVAPALPYPASDDAGALPADGTSTAPWMVRPPVAGRPTIEVLSNPLNRENQRHAANAMAEIELVIEAAQRKSDSQYERALAELRRTGRPQDVDGITLADEGVAGARIDAETRLVIDVEVASAPAGSVVASSVAPEVSEAVAGSVGVVTVPANVYRDQTGEERYCQAERWVYFGALAPPTVTRRGETTFEIAAAPAVGAAAAPGPRALVLRLKGNESLMGDLLRRADWRRVRALVP